MQTYLLLGQGGHLYKFPALDDSDAKNYMIVTYGVDWSLTWRLIKGEVVKP